MNASFLRPPNHWNLSDNVIRKVPLRASSDVARMSVNHNRAPATGTPVKFLGWKKPLQDEGANAPRVEAEPQKRGRDSAFGSSPESDNRRKARVSVGVATLLAMGEESLRKMRRENQRRYLQRQKDKTIYLEQETNKLGLEVKQLEYRRCTITPAVLADDGAWDVAVEYFRLFARGLREQHSAEQPTSNAAQPQDMSSVHFAFLRSRLAQDVVRHEGRGINVAIDSWRRISFWFQDFQLELESMHKDGADALLATTKTSFTITERTLRNVFPGVWNERESEVGHAFVNKLLGRRITMRGTTRFEWDTTRSLVTSILAQSDLRTPMLSLLGSLEDVARVFDKAVISPDFNSFSFEMSAEVQWHNTIEPVRNLTPEDQAEAQRQLRAHQDQAGTQRRNIIEPVGDLTSEDRAEVQRQERNQRAQDRLWVRRDDSEDEQEPLSSSGDEEWFPGD